MAEHSWDISFNITRTYTVQMTEAELVALMVKHNDHVPPADITEGRYHDTVIEAWTEQVCNELSVAALVDMAARPDAELTEEDADINDFDVSEDTTGEEDEAWRPSAILADPFLHKAIREPFTVSLAEAMPTAEPVAAVAGEWWRQ